ncbi:MAG: redoxin family protein [Mycoplasmataceae bacterium]|nr:redoxin family protein [Mycoplasmataceae bacterium]
MNKITIHEKEFSLSGETITTGNKLEFKGIDGTGVEFNSTSLKGKKVISIFPDINTGVCDEQTVKIAQLAKQNKDIEFISITMDEPSIITDWCAGKGVDNSRIVSDSKFKEFATKTNIYITEINKLARGFIVLDETNTITHILLNDEIAVAPDFKKLEELI